MDIQTLINRARKKYQALPESRQQELLSECAKPDIIWRRCIQFDITEKEPEKVVSAFFEMDIAIHSRYEYLFPEDVAPPKDTGAE